MQPEDLLMRVLMDRIVSFLHKSKFFNSWTIDRVTPSMAGKFIGYFDSLVLSFPALIALGISRIDDEDARSVLAENLYQECGEGDPTRTHHAIFREFVSSAGLESTLLQSSTAADKWRASMSQALLESKTALRALGVLAAGEFLAQPALTQIFSVVKVEYPAADVEYFTTHLKLETEHVKELTALLSRQMTSQSSENEALEGFEKALAIWDMFFDDMHSILFETDEAWVSRRLA